MPTPVSLADAEERRQQITLEIQGIQAQLGDKQRTDGSGRRLDAQEYWTWKKHAQHALNQKLNELRSLKAWIKERRPSSYDGTAIEDAASGVISHLKNLCEILHDLKEQDVDFDADELQKIEAARLTLRQITQAT